MGLSPFEQYAQQKRGLVLSTVIRVHGLVLAKTPELSDGRHLNAQLRAGRDGLAVTQSPVRAFTILETLVSGMT